MMNALALSKQFAEFGKIDVLVNNAGTSQRGAVSRRKRRSLAG